jgi:hypothetical protein
MLCGNGCPTPPNTYEPLPGRGTVVIEPMPVELQAPWTLQRTDIRDFWGGTGGFALLAMRPGLYTVHWGDVEGYTIYGQTESSQHLYSDETITFEVTYELPRGDIIIEEEPDTLYATWNLEGPFGYDEDGHGSDYLEDMPPGQYTISWEGVPGYVTPPDSTAIHSSGVDLLFLGVFVPE